MPTPSTTFTCSVVGCKSYCVLDPRDAAEKPTEALCSRGWLTVGKKHYCPVHHGQVETEEGEYTDAVSDAGRE